MKPNPNRTSPRRCWRKWFYVVAYKKRVSGLTALCFQHRAVKARSADEAYDIGMTDYDDEIKAEAKVKRLENNYVIEAEA